MRYYNQSITEFIRNVFKNKQESTLSELSEVAVFNVPYVPENEVFLVNTSSASGTLTLASLEPAKDVLITAMSVHLAKNVTCDVATGVIDVNCVHRAVTKNLFRIPVITLTAESRDFTLKFENPIRVSQASGFLITMTGTFTAGAMVRSISAFGYFQEKNQ